MLEEFLVNFMNLHRVFELIQESVYEKHGFIKARSIVVS